MRAMKHLFRRAMCTFGRHRPLALITFSFGSYLECETCGWQGRMR